MSDGLSRAHCLKSKFPLSLPLCCIVSVASHLIYLAFKSLAIMHFSNSSSDGSRPCSCFPSTPLFPFSSSLPVMFPQHPCLSTTLPLRCNSDPYQTDLVNRQPVKKVPEVKGWDFESVNPLSVCSCVLYSTLTPTSLFPCGFCPLWRLGKVNTLCYQCQHT